MQLLNKMTITLTRASRTSINHFKREFEEEFAHSDNAQSLGEIFMEIVDYEYYCYYMHMMPSLMDAADSVKDSINDLLYHITGYAVTMDDVFIYRALLTRYGR